jgi:hypothetical protein
MTAAHKEFEPSSFERPEGITTAQICIKSGLLAGEHCWPGYRRTELFAEDTRPTEVGNDFVAVNVMEVPEEALEEHPEFIEEYPCLQWNRWVEHDEECYGPHEGKFMYNRPPVDFEEVKQAAKIYYRGGYSLDRALRLIPRDALTMVPTVSCTDLPGVFEEPEPEPTEPIEGEEAEYSLEITDHLFKPMLLTIYKGQVAHLHITNTGEKKHNFSIDVLGIDVDVEPGETVVVDLQADNEGIYRFYDKHGRSRMKQGRLLVKVPEQAPEEETTP